MLLQDKKEEDGGDKQEFDAFMGNDAGMFAYGEYDEDDKEADRVWESIDARMDERRKVRREAQHLWWLLEGWGQCGRVDRVQVQAYWGLGVRLVAGMLLYCCSLWQLFVCSVTPWVTNHIVI